MSLPPPFPTLPTHISCSNPRQRPFKGRLVQCVFPTNEHLSFLELERICSMRQALEARLVAAEEIRKVVEQEKLDKEEFA
ncbi:hypothetical protein Syun_023087 [Stephania yunnanensis]|uniref:Uncharacterized protein n=1 Tax=Stephania yunnanensis TaxID=152371 RepID=A0AAP0F8A7_9MAGN